MPKYESIFWNNEWAHQKYYGWQLMHATSSFKVLFKQNALFKRYLVLSTDASVEEIGSQLSNLGVFGPLNEIILHDFSDVGHAEYCIAQKPFMRAAQNQRMLNIATFAIDLSADEETILQRMKSDYRRKLKKAKEEGIIVDIDGHPSPEKIAGFMDRYRAMASERSLYVPDEKLIIKMFLNGDAVLFTARKGNELLNSLLTYQAGDQSIFLYGVGGEKRNDGSGQYLHWTAIQYLKSQGILWYDLGGLANIDEANGIYRFKKGFGGDLIRLGAEFLYRPLLVKIIYRCFNLLKMMRAMLSVHHNIPQKNIPA